jgi:NADPH2:quinone reductase
VGPDVAAWREGDRVAWTGVLGSYAGRALLPADRAVAVPLGMSTDTAAAVMLQGLTAHYLSTSTYPLKKGDTCLVHAAAGGVGLLLVQMAKQRGARVIGTVGTEAKAALARAAGADEVILYSRDDFLEGVKRLTGGRGVDVVYDSVGKATAEKSLDCLVPRGLMVFFGNASGPVPPIDPLVLSRKGSLYLTRPNLVHYIADRASLEARAAAVLGDAAAGRLEVRIDRTYPLAEAAEAHRALEGRQTAGKVLLIPS